jgi:hypothetical protein
MNAQEAYEKIREHFTRPGAELGKNGPDGCLYFNPRTKTKCAVGFAAPDDGAIFEDAGTIDPADVQQIYDDMPNLWEELQEVWDERISELKKRLEVQA